MSVVISESFASASAHPSPEALLGAWAGSAALVYCRDWSGHVLAANAAFARKFGSSPADLVGHALEVWLHQDDAISLASADHALRSPPHKATSESRWLTPQGWRWIAWEEIGVHDAAGNLICARAVGHDITRQRIAEEQFFKLSRAVEQSPVATVITDAEGHAQYVNAKFTEATGHTLEQIIEDGIDVLNQGHPDEESRRTLWEAIRSGQEWRGEFVHDQIGDKKMWESVKVSCLRGPNGEITNLLCLREDITERKLLENQLRQAQKMESLGTLAGGIAHDFNNIIAVINGYAEFALLNPTDSALLQKCMREVKKASHRASGLVRQILTFSRKADVRMSPLDLNHLARELGDLLAETFPRNVSFSFNLDTSLPALLADQNQLQQVLLNLCVNARDAMPNGGTISLTTARAPDGHLPAALKPGQPYACLTVADTGTGMSPEVRARLFEPFFTTKAVNKGTGLGLAVVYGIVASHEGTIEVESEIGTGSSFKVYLPLADTIAPTTVGPRANDFPGGTESLLIVDDEAPLRLLLEAALSRKGYRVSSAADGLEAIEKIADLQQPLDAVLLDLNMPGANGIEVYKVIKASRPNLKALILTGHLSPEVRAEFEQLGQQQFIKKPYTLDEVGRALREILEPASHRN